MKIQKKSWIWWLQGPWRKMNTVIGDTLYYWENPPPPVGVAHCEYHSKQQVENGVLWHWIKYLLCWPVWKNSYRWKCEWDAYKGANHYTDDQVEALLGSYKYGWLKK